MKILIIEDSPELQAEMSALVSETGNTPILVSSGEEALQLVGVVDFDLVILDIEMPGLDGFETTTLMREALGARWVPIIFATTIKSDDSVLAGIEAGGDDYLIKPFSANLLKAKLTAMQRIAQMQAQLSGFVTELALLSEHDGLTQLLNRRAFTDKANHSLLTAKRQRKASALIMLDVDHFKLYNDSYGHLAGDDCLQQLAQVLKRVAKRDSDLVARYGGEEFIILLPETERHAAELIANKLIAAINQQNIPHHASPVADHVTISLGIELSNGHSSLDELIMAADKNLYRAKEKGRNQFVIRQGSSHKTLLIADDNSGNLTLLTNILKPLGNIITVDNPEECLELAHEIKPDLLLLDRDGTVINGAELLAQLKRDQHKLANKTLLISSQGHGEPQHINIAKPVNIALVRQAVAQLLG